VSARLRIALETRALERADAEVAIAGAFSDEQPLRGAAGRADWRLCGLLTRLALDGRLDASRGAATLVGTSARLAAPALLVVGLGERSRFGAAELEASTRAAFERIALLAVRSAAFAPFGVSGDEFVRALRVLVEAAAAGLDGGELRLSLCVPESEEPRVRRELARCVRTPGVELEPASAAVAAQADPPHAPLR